MRASLTISILVFGAIASAAPPSAAQLNKMTILTEAQSPNLCAGGYNALPFEHPAKKTFGQKYSCTGPQIVCSDGFRLTGSSSTNGKVTYRCEQRALPPPPPVPPHG